MQLSSGSSGSDTGLCSALLTASASRLSSRTPGGGSAMKIAPLCASVNSYTCTATEQSYSPTSSEAHKFHMYDGCNGHITIAPLYKELLNSSAT